ncbi:MAG: class I SAM-dependent methyltransferase [Acidobacteriota bacterium]
MPQPVLESTGFCPTCDQQVRFIAAQDWLRDHFLCSRCGSIPRERALMHVIETYYPNYRDLVIHESSPGARGASVKLQSNCPHYVATQFDPALARGVHDEKRGFRNEDLEQQTFADASFDLVVTQDVFEHLFDPSRAFAEVARTLKPGGAHIFTTPLVNKQRPSERCSERLPDDTIRHLKPPEYHGNPIDDSGSLVTFNWGYDIAHRIYQDSRLVTSIVHLDNLELGIRAEYIEVLVSMKRA